MPFALLFATVLLTAVLPLQHSGTGFQPGHRVGSDDAILGRHSTRAKRLMTGLPAPPIPITTSHQRSIDETTSSKVTVRRASWTPSARFAGRQAPPMGTGFGWPVVPADVVRRFDPPPRPWLPGHRGVDLAAPPSAVIHSAGAGTVIYAGVLAGRGVVSVAHPGGLRTTYEPIHATVTTGVAVSSGGELGTLDPGHPGCPTSACLHWGLRRGDLYLDPLALLGLGRVRLLPLGSPSSASPAPMVGAGP
jgi:murein DD-endopeptidase MepM/ murein hydrolase activator NlpD